MSGKNKILRGMQEKKNDSTSMTTLGLVIR
jgi:hypothetical protein